MITRHTSRHDEQQRDHSADQATIIRSIETSWSSTRPRWSTGDGWARTTETPRDGTLAHTESRGRQRWADTRDGVQPLPFDRCQAMMRRSKARIWALRLLRDHAARAWVQRRHDRFCLLSFAQAFLRATGFTDTNTGPGYRRQKSQGAFCAVVWLTTGAGAHDQACDHRCRIGYNQHGCAFPNDGRSVDSALLEPCMHRCINATIARIPT
jgi:hypothetical protein